MTVPGAGGVTAVTSLAVIDDPSRFQHPRDVGAHLGTTLRKHASGEMDRDGFIAKARDDVRGITGATDAIETVFYAEGVVYGRREALRASRDDRRRKRASWRLSCTASGSTALNLGGRVRKHSHESLISAPPLQAPPHRGDSPRERSRGACAVTECHQSPSKVDNGPRSAIERSMMRRPSAYFEHKFEPRSCAQIFSPGEVYCTTAARLLSCCGRIT
jgi:hypothetical protein